LGVRFICSGRSTHVRAGLCACSAVCSVAHAAAKYAAEAAAMYERAKAGK